MAKTNIIYREDGYLVLQKRSIDFDSLAEWFLCHLNDYVYVMNEDHLEGIIRCKDFENSLRDNKNEILIRYEFEYVSCLEASNRIDIYKRFRDDVTLFRLPVIENGKIVGEFYNSLTHMENAERYHIKNIIPELMAFKECISSFFDRRHINDLAIVTDLYDQYSVNTILKIQGITPTFYNSYHELKKDIDTGKTIDAVLDIKYPDEYREYFINKYQIDVDVYIIFDVMSVVLVECFAEYVKKNNLNLLAVYAVGKNDISYLGDDDANVMSKNKTLNDVIMDKKYLKKFYRDNEKCYSYATDKKFGQLGGRVVRFNGLYNSLMDVESNYINVKNGVRKTEKTPERYGKEIHFYGPCIVQGICVTDEYTIESYLQEKINKHTPDRIKVVNHGSATHTPYGSFCNDFLHAMNTEFCEGDIIIVMDAFTDAALEILKERGIPILMDHSMFDGSVNLFLNNPYHCNHIANEMYSDFIFNGLLSMGWLRCDDNNSRSKITDYFSENDIDLSFRNDSFLNNNELLAYSQRLKEEAIGSSCFKKIGGICTQANPFTLGHKALVEFAAKEMDFVYVFVAQDSLSEIQFLERIDIVKDALCEFDNVKVLSSGTYLSSYRMFPDYFTVSCKKNEFNLTNVWAETRIFAEVYCKVLGINYRILGEEPYDLYTSLLVKHLQDVLPQYGIETLVIPRALTVDNSVISASVVRKRLIERNYDGLEKYISPYAIELLRKYYSEYLGY